MRITETPLAGVWVIEPERFGDERGLFSETFKAPDLIRAGFDKPFIQDNLARSGQRHVVRGLHFQTGDAAQDKLVRVSRGAIFDVAVDLRPGSPTFGGSYGIELSSDNWLQLLVPAGLAHGYCTLEPACEVVYKVTAPYAPDREGGLLWCDPALGIDWPVNPDGAVVNRRDQTWPTLAAWLSAQSKA